MGFLQLSDSLPLFAASPDGSGKNFIVEIKTPLKNENKRNFIKLDGRPVKKVLLQILLQMHLCNKPFGFLLVPDEDFITNQKYDVVKVCLDLNSSNLEERAESKVNNALLQEALRIGEEFWGSKVFPLILRPMRPLIV
jgi:hypothetical protein